VRACGGAAVPHLDRYYLDCVGGGPGAFVLVARDPAELAATIRRKLVIEVSGAAPPARLVPAQFEGPVDCLIGEKMYRQRDWIR
jgi:hypothetical protein